MNFKVLTTENQSFFNDKWKEEVKKINLSGQVIPDNPSVGWLSNTAAWNEKCTASGIDSNGTLFVCGADLWKSQIKSDDPYLCRGHLNQRNKYIENIPKYQGKIFARNQDYIAKINKIVNKLKGEINGNSDQAF